MSSNRTSENVHLEFLLGSVHRNSRKKSGNQRKSESLSASREGTIGNYSPQAKQRWNRAREAISKGYLIFSNRGLSNKVGPKNSNYLDQFAI